MGTSSSFGGAGSNTPLVPSWLESSGGSAGEGVAGGGVEGGTEATSPPSGSVAQPSVGGAVPQPSRGVGGARFSASRRDYTRFASSGGTDRRALNRALSSYVRSGAGGARSATLRMGSSRAVAVGASRFFSDVRNVGLESALFRRGIEYDASQPACDVLLNVVDKMDFDGGPIDEAIARDAMVEAIVDSIDDLSVGIGELDDAVYPVLIETFVTKSILDRLIMDIGNKGVYVAKDVDAVNYINNQLEIVVGGVVSDAFAMAGGVESVSRSEFDSVIDEVYRSSFEFMEALGE